jgi:glutamyl-tRNA reductase
VAQAEAIIESRVRDFDEWVKARRAVPLIQDLRTRADALRRREMERALKQLARGESPEAVIEHLSQALTNKFLHDPMSTLREVADDAEQARLQAMLARFYSQSDD